MESGSESGSESGGDRDSIPEVGEGTRAESENEYEMDDWIVDADGNPIRSDRKKKKAHIFSDEPRQQAEDIFGVKFDYGEFEQYGDEEEMEEDYEEDEEAEEHGELKKRRKRKTKSIFEMYEPAELEQRHFTDRDNEIRNTDLPERMQLRNFPVTAPDDPDEELSREAEWVFNRMTKNTITEQDQYSQREVSQWLKNKDATIEKIRNALEHIRIKNFEPPYINFYCKEYVLPELKINDLWQVYFFDEEWCKLVSRKKSLRRLFEQCREFQMNSEAFLNVYKNPDAALPEDIRVVNEEDLERIDSITTFEELKDMVDVFNFYYSRDRDAIKVMLIAKKKEEREARKIRKQAEKKEKRKKTKTITNEEGDEIEVTDDEAELSDDNDVSEDEEPSEDEVDEEILKTPSRNDPYSLCKKLQIAEMAEKLGLKASEFGENLQDGYQKIDVRKNDIEPLKMAEQYAEDSPKLRGAESAADVLEHVKRLHSYQIAHDPKVRFSLFFTSF